MRSYIRMATSDSTDYKASLMRSFQAEMLKLVKSYSEQGIAYSDLLTLLLNLGSILAISSHRTLEDVTQILNQVYLMAQAEAPEQQQN